MRNFFKLLTIIIIPLILVANAFASYVLYGVPSNNLTNYGETFSSSDSSYYRVTNGNGNSISYSTNTYVPVISPQYPERNWVWMSRGAVPRNAIVLQYINGFPIYSCRVQNGNQIYYGELIVNKGCFVKNNAGITLFYLYQALTNGNY